MSLTLSPNAQRDTDYDPDYDHLRANLQKRADALVGPLFVTDILDLYAVFLDALPQQARQYNTCRACYEFVNRYGVLVTINENGSVHSAMWHEDDAPGIYHDAVMRLRRMVERAPVAGVFYSSERTWGVPFTDPWHHFAVVPPPQIVFGNEIKTARQCMAEKLHDWQTLMRALNDFTPEVLQHVVALLQSEALYRSEAVLGPATWLAQLRHSLLRTKNLRQHQNLVWRAVATAPSGFCHPRSTMIGTLLEDIAAGMDFDTVKKRFAAKMAPLQYQRPQAPPKDGNIAQAETLVARLGIADSLARRYARLDEVQTLWTPTPQAKPTGVFGHLRSAAGHWQNTAGLIPPAKAITWVKFRRDVMSSAETIHFLVPGRRWGYTALVTAVNPFAKPILQWDHETRRNPVSWYTYVSGSSPNQWGLTPGAYHPVSAIAFCPHMWADEDAHPQHGKRVLFVLAGAKDLNDPGGAALFPSFMRSELHTVRSTIEAYSNRARLAGREEASACGLMLSSGVEWNAVFRVVSNGATLDYVIDRWE